MQASSCDRHAPHIRQCACFSTCLLCLQILRSLFHRHCHLSVPFSRRSRRSRRSRCRTPKTKLKCHIFSRATFQPSPSQCHFRRARRLDLRQLVWLVVISCSSKPTDLQFMRSRFLGESKKPANTTHDQRVLSNVVLQPHAYHVNALHVANSLSVLWHHPPAQVAQRIRSHTSLSPAQ